MTARYTAVLNGGFRYVKEPKDAWGILRCWNCAATIEGPIGTPVRCTQCNEITRIGY